MASIEEKVEEHYKKVLDDLHIRHYGKTETINGSITNLKRNPISVQQMMLKRQLSLRKLRRN